MTQGSRIDRAIKLAQPFRFKEIEGMTNLCLATRRAN